MHLKRVYSHHDRFMVFQAKQLLDDYGIPCFVKNEYAIGGVGELSPFDSMPELWLSDEEWLPRATKLISSLQLAADEPKASWRCGQCNEQNDGHFELCWQCGNDAE